VQYRVKGTTAWTTVNITTNTSTLNIAGLTANTVYQWKVATKCKNNSTSSFSAFSAIKQFTTAVAFATNDVVASPTQLNTAMQLMIFPNPAKTNATLIVNTDVKDASISIIDFIGKTTWQIQGINYNHIELPIENLAAGIYLVQLINGDGQTGTIKFVKE
jgi:hypothetical protein